MEGKEEIIWQSQDPATAEWVAYDAKFSEQLEERFQENPVNVFEMDFLGRPYTFDYGRALQINDWGGARRMNRRVLTAEVAQGMKKPAATEKKKSVDGETIEVDTSPGALAALFDGQLQKDDIVRLQFGGPEGDIVEGFVVGSCMVGTPEDGKDGASLLCVRVKGETAVRVVKEKDTLHEILRPQMRGGGAMPAVGRPRFAPGSDLLPPPEATVPRDDTEDPTMPDIPRRPMADRLHPREMGRPEAADPFHPSPARERELRLRQEEERKAKEAEELKKKEAVAMEEEARRIKEDYEEMVRQKTTASSHDPEDDAEFFYDPDAEEEACYDEDEEDED